jgi:shikimate dehydrogenase
LITYGLIGYPLGHSFSVSYFTRKFREEGLDAMYRNFPLETIGGFRDLLEREPGLAGLNVTVPYKQAVIPFLDELDDTAGAIGAVNTIVFGQREGRRWLSGYNTDVTGFRRSLEEHLDRSHSRALVLGTGGASKAVSYVLGAMGIAFRMVSRRRGEGILSYKELDPAMVALHTLVINTTPLGMHPEVDSCPPIPYEALGPGHLLFDLVYNPARTLFLQKGEQHGASVVNGYDMLVYQAEASWAIWSRKT